MAYKFDIKNYQDVDYTPDYFKFRLEDRIFETTTSNLGWAAGTIPDFFYIVDPENGIDMRFNFTGPYKNGEIERQSWYVYHCEDDNMKAIIRNDWGSYIATIKAKKTKRSKKD
jgi:hypothetical protein